MPSSPDPRRLPVVIGAGQVNFTGDWEEQVEPVDLAARALNQALEDTGADPAGVRDKVELVATVNIISWRYRDPAALIAEQAGVTAARTMYTTGGGNTPQSLINELARRIAAGDLDLAVVSGCEAWRTRTATKRAGGRVAWTEQASEITPNETFGADLEMNHPAELAHGLAMPGHLYPICETALRHRAGRSVEEHQRHLGRLWARFAAVAATNPHARVRDGFGAEEIATVTPENRMIGYPYPLRMNSNSGVDQGAAVVIASVAEADRLGVPASRRVHIHAGTDGTDQPSLSTRIDLVTSPAIRIAGGRALELAGVGPGDLEFVDLYSCYPSAVQIAADELALGTDRDLTVTGGLSFAGGPWNDYVTHSVATMVHRLRDRPGAFGLVTANGGALSKHAFGVYSSAPPDRGFRHDRPQDAIDSCGSRAVHEAYRGPLVVEGYTVAHDDRGKPTHAVVAGRTPADDRAWSVIQDPDLVAAAMETELCGASGSVTNGIFATSDLDRAAS